MKSLSAFFAGAIVATSFMISACGNSEEDVVPQLTKTKPEKVEKPQVQAPASEEPQLVPIQSLSANKASAPEAKPAEPTKDVPAGSIQPLSEGSYVIQVSIQQSKMAANAIVKKLADQNIKAYIAEVEDPGELEGTYYRVRVGYFTSIKMAQDYGKQTLTALNFAWWVDNSKNDEVGSPNASEEESYSAPMESYSAPEEPAPEPAPAPVAEPPVPEPVAEPAPVEEAPIQEAPAAPEPVAEPAPEAPAAETSDDWD